MAKNQIHSNSNSHGSQKTGCDNLWCSTRAPAQGDKPTSKPNSWKYLPKLYKPTDRHIILGN